ncbi:hypothetical protein DRJ00_02450 [Candidatus Aerophobetes bacterium]|uniref:Uncharacterized protein n=1 Tax=Aerophobetes bacterium TaxID=2030807 RepID=A0A497E7M9_UNCAE|nr:hypothetical protein [Candidatus Aerophobetes bacterium]RLE10122.1 MAG: hypothetical protein DRJ00_02450 [Candidatus Aerophobetes bacterium]
MEKSVIMQGIAVIAAVVGGGGLLMWLSFRIKRLKAIPFVVGLLLLIWGAYLIFDFLTVCLS